jgi:glycosyltransferase involved in cell wall biosynthesis
MNGSAISESADFDLSVVVPAFNEERHIAETIDTILGVSAICTDVRIEVIVIDDGSVDRTAEIVSAIALNHANIRLIRNPRNIGLGSSLRVGLAHAAGARLLLVPGDNDLPEAALYELISHSRDADVVMCYFLNNEIRGRDRNLLSTAFGLIYTTAFEIYPQYINGPCVYPVKALRALEIFSTRFSIVAEINVKLLRQGVSFMEVASVRQVGLEGSTSFSFRNLWESATIFIRLCYEVRIRKPHFYSHRPIRLHPGMPVAKAPPARID